MSIADPLAVIDQAHSMWPDNSHAVEDPRIEELVLATLGKPTDAPNGRALLRRGCAHAETVVPLFEAVFGRAGGWSTRDLFVAPCDRCRRDIQPRHTLWVNAGATVVDIHMCDDCRIELHADLPDLVWG